MEDLEAEEAEEEEGVSGMGCDDWCRHAFISHNMSTLSTPPTTHHHHHISLDTGRCECRGKRILSLCLQFGW